MDVKAINRTRGDTYPIRLTLTQDGSPLDLTGSSFILTVSAEEDPTNTIAPVFEMVGVNQSPASAGVVEFTPTQEQADNCGYYYYDIQQTDSSGYIRTVLKGAYNSHQDITKSPLLSVWTPDSSVPDGTAYLPRQEGEKFAWTWGNSEPSVTYETIDGRRVVKAAYAAAGNGIFNSEFVRPYGDIGVGTSFECTCHLDSAPYGSHVYSVTSWIHEMRFYLDLGNSPPTLNLQASVNDPVTGEMTSVEASPLPSTATWGNGWYVFGGNIENDGTQYMRFQPEDDDPVWINVPGIKLDTRIISGVTFAMANPDYPCHIALHKIERRTVTP